MTVSREEIGAVLARYLAAAPHRGLATAPLISALGVSGDVASRRTFPLHITCSAVVVDAVGDVLMIWHREHGRWRLPGGHIEPEDPTMYGAALRRLEAVIGVACYDTIPAVPDDDIPVDVNVHAVPASPVEGEPSHVHADFRYAFMADRGGVSIAGNADTAFAWRPPYELLSPRFGASASRGVRFSCRGRGATP
ncbi:NUDIX domain-containing protein [Nonomuraea sp. NPDC049695]|uniref:NUDIX domain-containing protein n=1 Tax=Nonomuraea sp. NPDC049695 TaxID=3154734 RepID=UPI00344958CD